MRASWLWAGVLLAALSGCGKPAAEKASADASPAQQSSEPAAAPTAESSPAAADKVTLAIESFDGIQARVAANRGKVVVMDAWSTSCPPCMQEFHHLVALHAKYGPEQLACMSLSFDFEGLGTPQEVEGPVLDFLRKQGATFENLMSSEESDVLYRKFKLAAVPAVFVYDRAGNLRKRFDNEQAKSKDEAFTYAQVEQLVTELLKEPAPTN